MHALLDCFETHVVQKVCADPVHQVVAHKCFLCEHKSSWTIHYLRRTAAQRFAHILLATFFKKKAK